MFAQEITNPIPPLNLNYVNTLQRIFCDPDYALISLATAMIKPRVEEYSGIQGTNWNCSSVSELTETMRMRYQERAVQDEKTWKNLPSFHYFECTFNEGDILAVKQAAKELGLTEQVGIEAFVNQQLGISDYAAFIDEKTNAAYVCSGKRLMSLYHLTLAFISVLYPGLFKDHPMTKDEIEILSSLTNKTSDKFREKVSAALMYLKPDLLRIQLETCFKGFRERKATSILNDIDATERRIEENLSAYHSLIAVKEDLIIRYEGLKAMNDEDSMKQEKEIIDYMCNNKHVHDVEYESGALSFVADTLLTNFDLEKWNNAVRRESIFDNYRLDEGSVFSDRNNRKKLLEAIFNAKPLLFVRMKGDIELRLNRQDIYVPNSQAKSENNLDLKDYISNTHFKLHGCPGRNREIIVSYLREGDIIAAIECFIAAVGAINIGEMDLTFRPFVQELLNSTRKVLVTQDNQAMTPEEALLWLAKREENEE